MGPGNKPGQANAGCAYVTGKGGHFPREYLDSHTYKLETRRHAQQGITSGEGYPPLCVIALMFVTIVEHKGPTTTDGTTRGHQYDENLFCFLFSGTIIFGLSNHPVGWGFHTMREGIDPGNSRFRPRCVGDSDLWKDSRFGDARFSLPGDAGSKYPRQLATGQWG